MLWIFHLEIQRMGSMALSLVYIVYIHIDMVVYGHRI